MTEIIEIVFGKRGPARSKSPFQAGACGPARSGCGRIKWFANQVNVKFVTRPGAAALDVTYPPVRSPSETCGRRSDPVCFDFESFARSEWIGHAAVDARSQTLPLDPDHPIRGELIITADLATAQEAADVITDHAATAQEEAVGGNIFPVLMAPPPAKLGADEAAGPGKHRDGWDGTRRLVGGPWPQIGRMDGSRGPDRGTGKARQQELFHCRPVAHTAWQDTTSRLAQTWIAP